MIAAMLVLGFAVVSAAIFGAVRLLGRRSGASAVMVAGAVLVAAPAGVCVLRQCRRLHGRL